MFDERMLEVGGIDFLWSRASTSADCRNNCARGDSRPSRADDIARAYLEEVQKEIMSVRLKNHSTGFILVFSLFSLSLPLTYNHSERETKKMLSSLYAFVLSR